MIPGMIRVLVVDDHAIVRKAFARLRRLQPDIEVIGEAGDGKDAIAKTGEWQPEIVLMDMKMPIMDGVEATRCIHAEYPEVRVIGVSMFDSAAEAQPILDAGAVASVSKDQSSEVLLDAIRGCAGTHLKTPDGHSQGQG